MLGNDVAESGPQVMVSGAHRHPIGKTLEIAAAMTSRIDPNIRCAILLLEEDQLFRVAEHNLLPQDRIILQSLHSPEEMDLLSSLIESYGANVRPLVTEAAEFIGAILFFGDLTNASPQLEQELEQVCWIATLAIEQKHLTEELAYRAHHEPLTHLWNRVWMEGEIERVLTIAAGTDDCVGLIVVGLDRLRVINEVLGYQIGNEVLRQAAERLRRSVSAGCSIARGGGDDFMVLVSKASSFERLRLESEKLLSCFDQPFRIGEHELTVKASLGTAFTEGLPTSAADLQSR